MNEINTTRRHAAGRGDRITRPILGRGNRQAPAARLVAATVTSLALTLAACGSNAPTIAHLGSGSHKHTPASSSSGSPAGGGSASASGGSGGPQVHASIKMAGVSGANAIRFAACVRSHGVPSFPDPNSQGVFSMTGSAAGATQTAQFQRASRACRTLLHLGGAPPTAAQQAQALAQLLKYSECMRSHGVTTFPDPTSSGGHIGLQVHVGPGGIDPQSPIFQHAQKACASLQPGGPGAGP
jgi:hypothetical protein